MLGPGPIVGYNALPTIWTGTSGPLEYNFAAAVQTPDIQRMGVGRIVTYRQWGFEVGYLPPGPPQLWARGPDQPWGLGNDSTELDDYDQHQSPADASEVLRSWDVQRCVAIPAATIVPTGVLFELVRFDRVPSAAVAVLENLPHIIESAVALDDAGQPQFVYSNLNGEEPCRTSLVHPNPLVAPLTWRWHVTATEVSTTGGQLSPLAGPTVPAAIEGDDLVRPWADLRYGTAVRWGGDWQIVVRPRVVVRYWVEFFGPTNRYELRVGARLSGYTQLGGRRGAAIDAATTRTH